MSDFTIVFLMVLFFAAFAALAISSIDTKVKRQQHQINDIKIEVRNLRVLYGIEDVTEEKQP